MAAFDPYYKWRAIPPAEQPPDYYRLLGLSHFESDPDVIETQADLRMAFIQQMSTGPHVAASQQILNELSEARVCLLDPDRKVVYDFELHTRLGLRFRVADSCTRDEDRWLCEYRDIPPRLQEVFALANSSLRPPDSWRIAWPAPLRLRRDQRPDNESDSPQAIRMRVDQFRRSFGGWRTPIPVSQSERHTTLRRFNHL